MKEPCQCINIEDIRESVDTIDKEIISLLSKRAKYVAKASEFKSNKEAVKAEDRVTKMLRKRGEWAKEGGLNEDFVKQLYQDIVSYFISEELKKWESKS